MPHASYPGCELVPVHSVVCTADILQIHLPLLGTPRAILYPSIPCVLYALLYANKHLNTIVRILGSIKIPACSLHSSALCN